MPVTEAQESRRSRITQAETPRLGRTSQAFATKLAAIDKRHKSGSVSVRFLANGKTITTREALARMERGDKITSVAVRWTPYSRGKLTPTGYTVKVKIRGEKPMAFSSVRALTSWFNDQVEAHSQH